MNATKTDAEKWAERFERKAMKFATMYNFGADYLVIVRSESEIIEDNHRGCYYGLGIAKTITAARRKAVHGDMAGNVFCYAIYERQENNTWGRVFPAFAPFEDGQFLARMTHNDVLDYVIKPHTLFI